MQQKVPAGTKYFSNAQDSRHHIALWWVKFCIIKGFDPLSTLESDWMKVCLRASRHPEFPILSLHRKDVTYVIV